MFVKINIFLSTFWSWNTGLLTLRHRTRFLHVWSGIGIAHLVEGVIVQVIGHSSFSYVNEFASLVFISCMFIFFQFFPFFSPLSHSFSGLSFGNFSSYPFLEYETILEKIKWNQILFLIQNAFQTPRFFCSCWAASANWPELLSWQGGALYNRFTPCWVTKLLQKPETIFFYKTIFFFFV